MKKAPPPLQRILSVPELDWTKYRFMPESRFARQTGKKKKKERMVYIKRNWDNG